MPADLSELDAIELRWLIGARELSPLELLDACIARIEALNPAVNAICATDFERARVQARAAEQAVLRREPLGALHGLPVGIKDMEDTAGLLTTYGNIAYRGHVPRADCLLVQRLKAAGAIVAAKTNTPDMAAGANTRNRVWGATGNPFDPSLNAGGSSGGSAVALATGMLPLATGSDLAGSLRTPAALCGVVGFRPSAGLIPSEDRPLGWSPLGVLGPMARTVADAALLISAMVGADARDPISYPVNPADFHPLPPVDASRLRLGFTADFGVCIVGAEIRRVFEQRMRDLSRLVARCEPFEFDSGQADAAFDVLRGENFIGAHLEQWRADPQSLGPNVRANMELAVAFSLADRAWAHGEQTRLSRRMQALFERFDLLVAPISPLTPFPWTELYATAVDGQAMRNYYHWLGLTYIVTMAGNPALAVPLGVDEHGMPFGVQLIGRHRGDAALLAAGHAIERACAAVPSLRRARPDLDALKSPRPELKAIVTHPPLWPT